MVKYISRKKKKVNNFELNFVFWYK